ncbi:hypothetical protein PYCC9005_002265 [Savitreella phatthalungensis]
MAIEERRRDDATSFGIILSCLFLPPLAVLLLEGISAEFIISICLTILGWIPGVIYALMLWHSAGGLTRGVAAAARIERVKEKYRRRRASDNAAGSAGVVTAAAVVANGAGRPSRQENSGPGTTTTAPWTANPIDGSQLANSELTPAQQASVTARDSSHGTSTAIAEVPESPQTSGMLERLKRPFNSRRQTTTSSPNIVQAYPQPKSALEPITTTTAPADTDVNSDAEAEVYHEAPLATAGAPAAVAAAAAAAVPADGVKGKTKVATRKEKPTFYSGLFNRSPKQEQPPLTTEQQLQGDKPPLLPVPESGSPDFKSLRVPGEPVGLDKGKSPAVV